MAWGDGLTMADDITSGLLRAARALIGWTRLELAAAAGTDERMIASLEGGPWPGGEAALSNVMEALSLAGVEFIPPDAKGPGVRLLPRVSGWVIDFANRRMVSDRGQVWLAFYSDLGRFVLNGRVKCRSSGDDRETLGQARLALEEYYKANPGLIR
jgi:transcriptional regulator with XRE-family HTH domain